MPGHHRPHTPPTEPLEPRTLLSSAGGAIISRPSTPLPPLTDLTAANNHLLFINDDGSRGRELWRSDGTLAGSSLLKDINPGPADAFPSSVSPFVLRTEPSFVTTFNSNADSARTPLIPRKINGPAR